MVFKLYRKGCFTLLLLLFLSGIVRAQSIGDYKTVASGNWTTTSIWNIWNGTAWTAAGATPNTSTNVTISSGHTILLNASPQNCRNLTIEPTAKLYTNNTSSNLYIAVWGPDLICDGQIGNGAAFDGISFNFEGTTTTVRGTGIIKASRFRKNATTNLVTNLIIDTDVTLAWDQVSNTELYNNTTTASRFNVTVNAGKTLNCIGTAANPGNASINGVSGAGTAGAGGTINIYGTMNITGSAYLRNANPNANDSCSWIIQNGGLLRVGTLFVGASGLGGNMFRVAPGGKVEISGLPGFESSPALGFFSPLPIANNVYFFNTGSYCEYTGTGAQYVPSIPPAPNGSGGYGYLKIRGTGTKSLVMQSTSIYPFRVYNDFEISNVNGSPVFDCLGWSMYVGGSWYNYSQSGFNEGSGRVYFNLTGTSTINCPGGERFNLLNLQKASSNQVVFNTKVTITTAIEWSANGAYDLNGNDLVITNPAISAITGFNSGRYLISEKTDNSSRVLWRIGTPSSLTSYTIPFGKSSSAYVPFTYRVPAGTTVDTLKVATYATPPSNLPWPTTPNTVTNLTGVFSPVPDNRDATVDRFWQVNSTAATPPTVDMTFQYASTELPIAPYNVPTSMGAQFWNTATGVWQLPVLGTGTATYTVTVTSTNAYGPWTLVNIASPLPVELLNFGARPLNGAVMVSWITASELNNAYFDVERSADGRAYNKIGTLAGAGSSSLQHDYQLRDENPLPGISYYRLKQVDYDGTSTYSNVVAVQFHKTGEGILYPQPAADEVIWEMSGENIPNDLVFSVYTPSGALVCQQHIASGGNGIFRLSTRGLSNSVYFLTVSGEDFLEQKRLLIHK